MRGNYFLKIHTACAELKLNPFFMSLVDNIASLLSPYKQKDLQFNLGILTVLFCKPHKNR
jgi:hypothetical protein